MILYHGVDTLKLGYQCVSSDKSGARLIDIASHCKSKHEEVTADFGGVPMTFFRIPKKADGGPYTMAMRCHEWTTVYAPGAVYGPRGNDTPNFMTTFRAEALARYGVETLARRAIEVMEVADVWVQADPQVSRIDLCADVTGELGPSRLQEFTCRSKQRIERQDGPAFNYYFGSRGYDSLEARLYRKDYQSSKEPHAAWVRGVWRGWDGFESVTRTEFELGRKWCRELSIGNYSQLSDVSLAEAWRYLTCSWMYMLGEPVWYEAASSFGTGFMARRLEVPRQAIATLQLEKQAAGVIRAIAAMERITLDEAAARVLRRLELSATDTTMPEVDGSSMESTPVNATVGEDSWVDRVVGRV